VGAVPGHVPRGALARVPEVPRLRLTGGLSSD